LSKRGYKFVFARRGYPFVLSEREKENVTALVKLSDDFKYITEIQPIPFKKV